MHRLTARGWFGSKLREYLELESQKYIHIPANLPELILIVEPCRSGTTALSNTFARLGIITDEQPRKSIGRALEEGSTVPEWNIQESGILVSKETLGPRTEAEYFNPIDSLTELEYPPDKINLIAIVREPIAALSSCQRMWGSIEIPLLERTYIETLAIAEKSRSDGINTTFYVHESIRDNPEDLVFQRLCRRLALPFDRKAVDWTTGLDINIA